MERCCLQACCLILAGCAADSPSTPAADRGVIVSARASNAGFTWKDGLDQTLQIDVNEVDGKNTRLTWDAPAFATPEAAGRMTACLNYDHLSMSLGGLQVSGSDPLHFYRARVDRCAGEAGAGTPHESTLAGATAFDTGIGVGPAETNLRAGGGNPVHESGSGGLGAVFTVSKAGVTDLSVVYNDAERCGDAASQQGVVDRYESPEPQDSSGFYQKFSSVSVSRLAMRFATCLQQAGYTVRPRSTS